MKRLRCMTIKFNHWFFKTIPSLSAVSIPSEKWRITFVRLIKSWKCWSQVWTRFRSLPLRLILPLVSRGRKYKSLIPSIRIWKSWKTYAIFPISSNRISPITNRCHKSKPHKKLKNCFQSLFLPMNHATKP